MTKPQPTDAVHVPTGLNMKTRFFARTAGLWRRLSALETAAIDEEISRIQVKQPIYVTGVPRAGTTITTELLERHPDVTSHRYSDFPNIFTPYWRNWLADRSGRSSSRSVERSHGDRIMVTPESPEAVEEVIWMQFFEHLHDPAVNQVLDEHTENPAFETFYHDHLRKLLAVRGASRYLAKGNYNITRMRYIQHLYRDAKFLIIIRNPLNHIASLVKQDRRFQQASDADDRVPRQLASSGHFEFGPHQRALNTGDPDAVGEIQKAWQSGQLVEAWARYWADIYGHALDQLECHEQLRQSTCIAHYEALCRNPEHEIRSILKHCELHADPYEETIQEYSARISEPDYYKPDFSDHEIESIAEITAPVARKLGYKPAFRWENS